jgi:hypothetical protein
MGRFYYARASGEAIYNIEQRVDKFGMGFDQLPLGIRQSHILTGNDLAQLAALEAPPSAEALEDVLNDPRIDAVCASENPKAELHRIVQTELAKLDVLKAASLAWWGESAFKI